MLLGRLKIGLEARESNYIRKSCDIPLKTLTNCGIHKSDISFVFSFSYVNQSESQIAVIFHCIIWLRMWVSQLVFCWLRGLSKIGFYHNFHVNTSDFEMLNGRQSILQGENSWVTRLLNDCTEHCTPWMWSMLISQAQMKCNWLFCDYRPTCRWLFSLQIILSFFLQNDWSRTKLFELHTSTNWFSLGNMMIFGLKGHSPFSTFD